MNNNLIIKPDKILYGKDIFEINVNSKTYYIYKIDTELKESYMTKIFKWFMKHSKNKNKIKHYIGIDFEFNKISKLTRDVALMQINLENELNIGYIFILNPTIINIKTNKVLIRLLTRRRIIKILHGSESLDIPYLYNQLLISNENIHKFSKNFYDTKLICDFNKISSNENYSCSIYELLVEYKIITKDFLKLLDENEENMPPLWTIQIDIYNMSEELFLYTLYDVIFLPELMKNMFSINKYHTIILSELFSLINKDKRKTETFLSSYELYVNKYNNYYFFYDNKIYTLVNIWKKNINTFLCTDIIKTIYQINYTKNFIVIFTKLFLYNHIITRAKVFQTKNTTASIENNDCTWLIHYPKIMELINTIKNKILKTTIDTLV